MTKPGPLDIFERERARLFSLAYRMMGERGAAEDIVQEAWIKWSAADHGRIESAPAWLTTVTTRVAIDELRSARVRRETYVGPWLPEALVAGEEAPASPDANLHLRDDINLALLWAMERLAPEERAAYLLHDMFDTDYADIAATLDKSEDACRQLVSRARKRVRQESPRFDVTPEEVSDLLERFMTATVSLDKSEILALLSPDAVALSDGGGKVSAALRPLEGPAEIAQVWMTVAARRKGEEHLQRVTANGLPAFAILGAGESDMILTVMPGADGRIGWIYILRNPEKLAVARA